MVGLLESLLTASIVDEMTGTKGNRNREVKGQGIANCFAGVFGGMTGCAMIGQSVINVKSGGRGRLSSLVAGLFLLVMILGFGNILAQIPMAALVGVMIMVAISTFEWHSIKEIHKVPVSDAAVMLLTMVVVVYTHDLAKGVITGVILSALIFGWRISSISATSKMRDDEVLVYTISGQLFFGTMSHFIDLFTYDKGPNKIEIDFSNSHIWDQSAVMGIARVIDRFQAQGRSVYVISLNKESQTTLDKGFS